MYIIRSYPGTSADGPIQTGFHARRCFVMHDLAAVLLLLLSRAIAESRITASTPPGEFIMLQSAGFVSFSIRMELKCTMLQLQT